MIFGNASLFSILNPRVGPAQGIDSTIQDCILEAINSVKKKVRVPFTYPYSKARMYHVSGIPETWNRMRSCEKKTCNS
jgi:hypothetical protein